MVITFFYFFYFYGRTNGILIQVYGTRPVYDVVSSLAAKVNSVLKQG